MATPSILPTEDLHPLPPVGKGPASSMRTLTGTVQSGVEQGCLLLEGFQLLGGDQDLLTSGSVVVVEGRPDRMLSTTCQQGTPFVVSAVRPG